MQIIQPTFKTYREIETIFKELEIDFNPSEKEKNYSTDIENKICVYFEKKEKQCIFETVTNKEDFGGSAGTLEYKDGNKITITYSTNPADYPVFTLLHEFAHAVLHIFPNDDIQDMIVDRALGIEKKLVEREADIFASIILSPLKKVVSFIKKGNHKQSTTLKDVIEKFHLVPESVIRDNFNEERDEIIRLYNIDS